MDKAAFAAAAADGAAKLLDLPGILAIGPGERWQGGQRTGEDALVVTVAKKLSPDNVTEGEDLHSLLAPVPVDVQEASPLQLIFTQPERFSLNGDDLIDLEEKFGYPFPAQTKLLSPSFFDLRRARPRREISYEPPPGAALGPLSGEMRVRCHCGPDAGWRELSAFISRIEHKLVVGMYDLTGPHIGDALIARLRTGARTFHLVLDDKESVGTGVKSKDRTDKDHVRLFGKALGNRFESAFAFTDRNGATFFSDYHIKVAVRDSEEFWMSSGSWQSSNQSPLDPLGPDAHDPRIDDYNREWHLIGYHQQLAQIWETYLQWDLKVAERPRQQPRRTFEAATQKLELFVPKVTFHYQRFFAPQEFTVDASKVKALLTPDNYIAAATTLIDKAQRSLLVQNQSLTFLSEEGNQDSRYTEFTRLLARKSHELDDFRMIVRDPREFAGDLKAAIKTYGDKGFNIDRLRFQAGCHNKGIIADGERLMLGSHNITNAGLTANRDASVIIEDHDICEYYRPVFEHDWNALGEPQPLPEPRLASATEFAPPGMVRMSLAEIIKHA